MNNYAETITLFSMIAILLSIVPMIILVTHGRKKTFFIILAINLAIALLGAVLTIQTI